MLVRFDVFMLRSCLLATGLGTLLAWPLAAAHASPNNPPAARPESVHEYVDRTREWSRGQYRVTRQPDRLPLHVYRVDLLTARPGFVEGGVSFEVYFDHDARRVVGERHIGAPVEP